MKVADLKAIRIKLASPEEILSWSHGEVKKPETINYRTQRPEKDGLFCEKIFGPSKDYECYCGKYKGIRFKGIICDRCGVEVTKSAVRRERMGHIKLAAPCSHIWFLRGIPSRIGMVLDLPSQKLERVIYFASYIITEVDEKEKQNLLKEIEEELKNKIQEVKKSKATNKEKTAQIKRLKELAQLRKQEVLSIHPLKILTEPEYREYSLKYGEIFTAGTGAETLKKIFEKIDIKKEIKKLKEKAKKETGASRKKTLRRLKLFEGMEKAKIRPEWMFLEVLPVLPPDLRPMVQLDGGRYASSDLNDLYRRVINRNNRLKYLLEISAPEVIVRNEKRMLQEAVDALLDNSMRKTQTVQASTGGKRVLKSLADILEGKQGRFRRNLLGKRVDYSGRSVIAPGPEFQLHQCGIPKIMALELFRPFVIKKLLEKELAYNIRGAQRLIDEGIDEVWAVLEEVVKDKLILLNRAPTLHRLGIQAFQPVLIEGEAIKIHPLVCQAYNADFDGDQMAVYLPLSEDAQKESTELMLSSKNLLKPADGLPIVTPTQDIILGCYYLTGEEKGAKGEGKVFSTFEEAILAYQLGEIDLRAKIKVLNPKVSSKKPALLETTCGRIIFNEVLPKGYPFLNEQINKKKLSGVLGEIIEKYPEKEVQKILDKIKELGFEYSTLSGISWGMDDLIVPPQKQNLLAEAEKEVEKIEEHFRKGLLSEKEKSAKIIEIWQGVKEKVEKLVPEVLPKDGPVFSMVDSGARGSWAQPVQMAGMKGLVTSPTGEIIELPIKHSFKEGFDVLEYFISTHGARKGTADTALRTSVSGYLTRRLVDVAHEVIVTEEDCGDKKGREVFREDAEEIGQDFRFKIVGRIALEDVKVKDKILVKKGEIIDWHKAKEIDKAGIEKVRVRSVLSCKTQRGICQKCYGWEMGRNRMVNLGEAVGIIAAQSIGEPGTQLTMRTFHLGGVTGGGDITRGLPRVEEVFETRLPKYEGLMSPGEGVVKEVDPEKRIIKIEIISQRNPKKKSEIIQYKVPPESQIFVKKGDKLKAGQPLSEGSLELRRLFRITSLQETQRYILKEVQKIYVAEGINIHDKHIEIIIRQMFSRVRITDPGDGPWVPGEIVSRAEFEEVNENLEKQKLTKAKGTRVLLGISQVALSSDSFLSAASFQETSRVLIKAALEGKEDRLHGLKENVIIGRLIPAGTGFRK
ncbi:MAG: DNA-directed RNA polymerase subunit beta' [Candidatus Nealsonbacteria bacterium]|nr:MAG: DNA-directed RNA polymerase subunit beta' [Candidatus Nealsonbacteria bacterium]